MSGLSEEQELEIIDLFLYSKLSLVSIAEKYGRKSRDFVYSILEKHGIDKKKKTY